jgi:cold shock CspA family protein
MTEQLPFRGRVKTWKKAFGYGFVTRSDDFRDVFVHANVLKGTGIAGPLRVRFEAVTER